MNGLIANTVHITDGNMQYCGVKQCKFEYRLFTFKELIGLSVRKGKTIILICDGSSKTEPE